MYPTLIEFGPIGIHTYGLIVSHCVYYRGFCFAVRVKTARFCRRTGVHDRHGSSARRDCRCETLFRTLGRLDKPPTNSFPRVDWSGTAVSSVDASPSRSLLSAPRTRSFPQLISSDRRSYLDMASVESGASSPVMATTDPLLIFPGRWRSQTAPSQPMSLYTRRLYMSRSCHSRFFGLLWSQRHRFQNVPGTTFGLSLMLLGVERFIAEFWRLTPRVLDWMSAAQIFSIFAFVVGIALIFWMRSRPRLVDEDSGGGSLDTGIRETVVFPA